MLDHHHGVGTTRHRRASHDLYAFTWAHDAIKPAPGFDFADAIERHTRNGRIGCAYREPVARRAIEWRIVPVGSNTLR
jgi:hypothetical protein